MQPRFSCLLISPTLSEHNIGCTPAPHQYWKAYRLVAGRPLPPPHVGSTNPCPSLSLPSRAMPRQRGFLLNLQKPPHGPQSVSESTRKGGEGEARETPGSKRPTPASLGWGGPLSVRGGAAGKALCPAPSTPPPVPRPEGCTLPELCLIQAQALLACAPTRGSSPCTAVHGPRTRPLRAGQRAHSRHRSWPRGQQSRLESRQ